jgi:hypothetical protein
LKRSLRHQPAVAEQSWRMSARQDARWQGAFLARRSIALRSLCTLAGSGHDGGIDQNDSELARKDKS